MESSLYLLIVLIEWVLLITIAAPLLFIGRFRRTPSLGILLWFAALGSSLLASILGVGIAVSSIFNTYFQLQSSDDTIRILLVSFAPWILLALAGILIALINQRLSPLFEIGKRIEPNLGGTLVMEFRGLNILRLNIPGYFAFAQGKKVFLSRAVLELPDEDLDAVLVHELAHINLHHEMLKKMARFVYQLLPWVAASKALVREVDVLCEVAADRRASTEVSPATLLRVRKLFV